MPLGTARRAFAGAGELEVAGELSMLPGTLDRDPRPAPPALLLAAFDTLMLGWATRQPFVAATDDRHLLPGGGMIRPVVLGAGGRAVGAWRLEGSGRRRKLQMNCFGRAPSSRAVAAETAGVGRFLGLAMS